MKAAWQWAPITLSGHQQQQQQQCDASLSRPMQWIAENLSLPSRKHSLPVEFTIFNFNMLKHLSSVSLKDCFHIFSSPVCIDNCHLFLELLDFVYWNHE